jgi:hypothetical protein
MASNESLTSLTCPHHHHTSQSCLRASDYNKKCRSTIAVAERQLLQIEISGKWKNKRFMKNRNPPLAIYFGLWKQSTWQGMTLFGIFVMYMGVRLGILLASAVIVVIHHGGHWLV